MHFRVGLECERTWDLSVGWCANCNVPVAGSQPCGLCSQATEKMRVAAGEIKPVFGAETEFYRLVISRALGDKYSEFLDRGLAFCTRSGELVIDGKKIFNIRYDSHGGQWTAQLTRSFERNPVDPRGTELGQFLQANAYHVRQKEHEAVCFLRETRDANVSWPLAVSFSGGKDSTVALALTRKICRKPQAVFMNTAIEFDETVLYSRAICEAWDVRLHELAPPTDFMYLIRKLGPPSRIMRWCCKTQKFGPLNRFVADQYSSGVLMVAGIRRAESNSRSRLSRIQTNHMVPKEKLVFPILDWTSLDVWLYILYRRIPYNPLYDRGYRRVGCWACPEKSSFDSGLVASTHPDLGHRLNTVLREFALSRGLDDVEGWIADGTWKQWKTQWQQSVGCAARDCIDQGGVTYRFENPELAGRATELMKVFGDVRRCALGSIIDGSEIHIAVTGNGMRATFEDGRSRRIFEKQLRKALNCVGCGACVGSCPRGAISVIQGFVSISEKCIHCLKCATSNGIRMNCVALNYKPDILSLVHRGLAPKPSHRSQVDDAQVEERDTGPLQQTTCQ